MSSATPSRHPQAGHPKPRRRIPAFHPVPVRARKDGWTPERQGAFIGYLAQTLCVAEAARCVGMDVTSAYRLRRRAGAAGFANAWDVALGRRVSRINRASAKSTGLSAAYRFHTGLVQVVMRRGKYRRILRKNDDNAMLQLLAQCDRPGVHYG
ncbi:hypothetical protein [Aurantiacibacter sediminis]|uniref:Uncharacterized protein n=1 Tax=Aurantiacibacter sediminis TaxID=2793064 RepID=A0ABS0MZK6_9SPHN|nr:hypothetical protein [Aurantiacibacter sediminis]MBH5321123.1 hypothetical protein [Aurantiacibacter sediminis]